MRVLGLDPGLAITGYGVVDGDGQVLMPIAYGVVRTPAQASVPQRLAKLYHELVKLIERYHPDVAAVEEIFFATNARTAITVGEARGVLLLTLAEAGVPIVEYTPLQVKQAITGYGQADKQQVQQMVRLLLDLHAIPRPDDVADALAVSICHHHTSHMATLYQGQA